MKRRNFLGAVAALCVLGWFAKPKKTEETSGALWLYGETTHSARRDEFVEVLVYQIVDGRYQPTGPRVLARCLFLDVGANKRVQFCRDKNEFAIYSREC